MRCTLQLVWHLVADFKPLKKWTLTCGYHNATAAHPNTWNDIQVDLTLGNAGVQKTPNLQKLRSPENRLPSGHLLEMSIIESKYIIHQNKSWNIYLSNTYKYLYKYYVVHCHASWREQCHISLWFSAPASRKSWSPAEPKLREKASEIFTSCTNDRRQRFFYRVLILIMALVEMETTWRCCNQYQLEMEDRNISECVWYHQWLLR
jgi:hypothetical protein